MAGRKREAGDAIVETRVGAAQARVGFVSFVRWIAPIAKNIAQMALELSNSKISSNSNSNSNLYNPIWHRIKCCGVKWVRVRCAFGQM